MSRVSLRALGAGLALAAATLGLVAAPAVGASAATPKPVWSPTRTSATATAAAAARGNLLQGRSLYADSQDWNLTRAMKTGSRSAARLAQIPQAKWIGPNDQPAWISDYLGRAQAAGQVPSLVLYAVPGRDCGSYSAGGFTTSAQYLTWVRMVRQSIAARPTVVVVEPDALAQGSCSGSAADTAARAALLGQAVDILTADRTTSVYLDAGHEWWMTPQVAAQRLVAAHVQKARGFSLNVSNFYATPGEVAFGQKVAAIVKTLAPSSDPHFVVDTSRNGNGPAPAVALNWCNPSGRQLGTLPGAVSGQGALDGYLWVKHPGESDGSCRPGEPSSGQWYGAWADDIVTRTLAAWGLS